jgi:hypothetical protein
MRLLSSSSGFGALAFMLATPAAAETVISTAVTSPAKTSVSGDIRISSTGSVKPTSGAAVTIDSNNAVKNEGTIAIRGANDATGILANTNLSGDITNAGTITIDEDYTPVDSDKDGDLDGPFAQGSNRFGIHVLSGGTYTGNIVNSGTIGVEGNQSAGIAIDSALTGSLTDTGKIGVVGDGSVGVRTSSVSGNVTIGSGTTSVQGKDSIGVLLGGDVGGAVVIQGSVTATGYRNTTAPADTSKLDADDLLQGGSAVVVAGNVGGGILLDTKPAETNSNSTDDDGDGIPDASETTATIATAGSAPAMVIGSASQDVHVGQVGSTGAGLINRGNISGVGVYNGVTATALSIGGLGHAVTIDGGIVSTGTIAAIATGASATALHIGAGASVPQIVNGGTIRADGGGASSDTATAILIDQGATVNSISNSGTIAANRNATSGSAGAIVDKSGTVALVQNSGTIGVVNADLGDLGTAIDLRANVVGAVIRQVAPGSGSGSPLIFGNVFYGSGNDTLDIQAGKVVGNVDFGGGTDVLSLSGTSVFQGKLANSDGLAVSVGTGSTLDVQNIGTVNLASLTTAANSNIGVTIAEGGNTLYNVAGAASFGSGTKVLVTLDHVSTAPGTYTIIDAGTLTGADSLSSSVVTLPFLFTSKLTPDASTGEVKLEVGFKGSGELQLNKSETAIFDAALAAVDKDKPVANVFLAVADAATLKRTLQEMMPDHAGGAFEIATKGPRLAAEILDNPHPVGGLWMQQVAWSSDKSIGDTSSYSLNSWGATAGYELPVSKFGSFGLTGGYFYGKDGHLSDDLSSQHYEGGIYWRGGIGPLHGWARATAGTIKFDSKRNFTGASTTGTVTRTADGNWKGQLYSASAGLSYEAHIGRLSLRPNTSIEYYKLNEDGYTETGAGNALDLTVADRKSNETAVNLLLSAGYDFMSLDPENGWMRVELEGGRREILSSSIGSTTASFGNGAKFTLEPEDRTSGWRGALRLVGGGSAVSFVIEADAEQQQDHTGIGGRLGLNLAI